MVLGDHLYRSQLMMIDAVCEALRNDVHDIYLLKSRQLGESTIIRAVTAFWHGIFRGLRGAVVFDTGFNTEEARVEIKAMIDNLPARFRFPKIGRQNRSRLTLEDDEHNIFSQILFMTAGRSNSRSAGGLGRSVGINFAHCSEISSWANEEGLASFRRSLAENFDNRLYCWESTARGFNIWHQMFRDAKEDPLGKLCLFIGWWAKDNHEIAERTQLFERYGREPPNRIEQQRIDAVRELYGWRITPGQLAWYRRMSDPAKELEEGEEEDALTIQEEPWCLVAGTRVGTARGILPIEEVRPGDVGTLAEVERSGPTGEAETWRATTRLGYEVLGTANHPLIKPDGSAIELVESMGAEIRLASPRFADDEYVVQWRAGVIDHSVRITPDLARLIGIYMGDGSVQDGARSNPSVFNVSIHCDGQDKDIVEECRRLFLALFGVEACLKIQPPRAAGSKGCIVVRANSRMVVETFRRLGLTRNDTGATQRLVYVPEFIFRSPRHVVKEFLSGLFETDGFVGFETPGCVLFSKYEQFIKDVQILLLGFGITCRRRSVEKKAGSGAVYMGHELHLRAGEAVRFHAEIGFLSARKLARAALPAPRMMPREIGRWAHEIELVDRVETVEKTGRTETVFNLAVGGDHWFDANGIITHNTEREAFQQTGASFFQREILTATYNRLVSAAQPRPQIYKFIAGQDFLSCDIIPARRWREAELRVWEEPVSEAHYVVAGDPAFGRDEKNNHSAATVLRCYADGADQVAEYASPLCPPHHFAWLLLSLVGWYGGTKPGSRVLMIVEINGPGEEVWRQYQATLLLVQKGYLRQRAEEKGIGNLYQNARSYVYARSDSMHPGHNWQWKALDIETPLPTPTGWVAMGDVKVGDKLFSESGGICSVIDVGEINRDSECYSMVFDDGSEIISDAGHLWEMDDGQILRTVDLYHTGGGRIKIADPLMLPDADLPIDPYVLGVWLGDGNSASARITSHQDDMIEMRHNLISCGADLGEIKIADGTNAQTCRISGLQSKLRENGLLGYKHIPPYYLRSSYEQRMELLRGLMDTDGTITQNNGRQCGFATSNEMIAAGFAELLRSVGIKAGCLVRFKEYSYRDEIRTSKPAYQFRFTAYDVPLFKLKRKLDRQQWGNGDERGRGPGRAGRTGPPRGKPTLARSKRLRIISIEKTISVPVRCIAVDSPSKLYLAGYGMVPTHNSTQQNKVQIMEALRNYTQSGLFTLNSIETLQEMESIRRDGDVIGAEGANRDDRTFAAALALRGWDDPFRGFRRPMILNNQTRQAERARVSLSIEDQRQLFETNMLRNFFLEKENAHIVRAREARRLALHRGVRAGLAGRRR